MLQSRIKNLQANLENPILIKKKENLFYLTGRSFDYRAEEYLLIKPNNPSTTKGTGHGTEKRQKNTEGIVGFGSGLEQIDWVKKSDRLKNIGSYLKGAKQLSIEWGFTFGEGEYLKFRMKNLECRIKPSRSQVDEIRQIKSAEELEKIKKSMQIVEKVFALARKEITKSGMTEKKLAEFITKTGYKFGAGDVSFPAIVASGSNAAIPHHVPSLRKLRAGESVIIDFGFKYQNYCSDFTRTVFLKKVPKILEVAYNQTEKAYNGSIEYVSSSLRKVTGNDVYQKSVDILAEEKLDKYFIHSLGHGTGLEIHELPNLSPKSKDELKDGMVFSIEPGVYIPKLGGIRIEDLVYLENGKVKKFINVPTKLNENIL